jgi:nitrate reductase gamma subunit
MGGRLGFPCCASFGAIPSSALLHLSCTESGALHGACALFLFWRRLGLPRTLYISNLPDYFALLLLGLIAGTGLMVSYWLHVYIVDAKAFILGLITFHPVEVPHHPLFLLHLFFVLTLMIYFPFSKLVHAGGIIFSPSRHQPFQVQVRGKRYVNPLERGQ